VTGATGDPGVSDAAAHYSDADVRASDAKTQESGDVTGARSSLVGLVVMLVLWAVVAVRLYALTTDKDLLPWYAAGLGIFLVVQLVVLLHRGLPAGVLHLAFALQCAIVLLLLSFEPKRDFLTALFVSQCYQAGVVLAGRVRLVWVAVLVTLIGASLMTSDLGPLDGLSFAVIPMVAGVVLAMYVVVGRDLEAARAASQRMVADLRAAQRRLELYAGQAEELAAIEARSRVARELDESVSRTLSDVLTVARSAQPMLDRADEAGPMIERLQTLTQEALAQMRGIIAELRPALDDAAEQS
jgi:signal transduction histidine kinase